MITIIPLLLKYWRCGVYGFASLAIIITLLWLGHVRQENHNLHTDLQQLQQENITMQARLKTTQARAQKTIAALALERQQQRLRQIKIQNIQKGIHNAAPNDDGPVAPVLRSVLEQLRQPEPYNID